MESHTQDPTPPNTHEPPAPQRVSVPQRWQIPGDVVHSATAGLPDFEREQLRWLQRYAAQRNHTRSEIAALLVQRGGDSYSADSVYQALTGRRSQQGASLRQMAEAISALRKRVAETEASRSTTFVETTMTRQAFALCRRAFEKRRVGYIFGPPQLGKSVALDEYSRRHNHGETHLVRMPTRGAISHFLSELAHRVKVPSQRREDELRRRIFDCFDENTLLIVDEAHQCLLGRGDTGALTLEFIREIHDRRKCGVVICGTEVLSQSLATNKILRQLWLRRSPGLVLNLTQDCLSPVELAQFARAFGLDEAPDHEISITYVTAVAQGDQRKTFRANPLALQTKIIQADGLGSWCKLLEDANDLAKVSGGKITWGKVLTAYCLSQAGEIYLTPKD